MSGLSPFGVSRFVVPRRLLARLVRHVTDAHPHEAGGYVACERDGRVLRAVDVVPLANESETPLWRFETTTDRAPPTPRVFFHSHTTAASPSGLTKLDRKIPERFLLVVFVPHGEPSTVRCFRRSVFNWTELRVDVTDGIA